MKRRYKKPKIYKRFELDEEGEQVVDNKWDNVIGYDTKKEGKETAKFTRDYVKRHGDISFYSFPYTWDQEFTEDQLKELEDDYSKLELYRKWKEWGGWY